MLWCSDVDFDRRETVHVYPLNDLREHVTDGAKPCWCVPVEDDCGVMVHNSLDGREKYESGERRPH